MSDLSKQQLILLALLVSFVTALATGIVTVSLMNQAPQGVTQTISQVIERTIQAASSGSPNTAAAVLSSEDQISHAIDQITPSLVRIKDPQTGLVYGLGLVTNYHGIILTDKSAIAPSASRTAVFMDGQTVPVVVIQSQVDGDIVFLSPDPSYISSPSHGPLPVYIPFKIATSTRLGATAWSLTGTTTPILGQGTITEVEPDRIITSIPPKKVIPGSPLFNIHGEIMGMYTSSLVDTEGVGFVSISSLKDVMPR